MLSRWLSNVIAKAGDSAMFPVAFLLFALHMHRLSMSTQFVR